jgi:hypothetical protein
MSSETKNYSAQGKTFGKIIFGILAFIILLIYVYHHASNQPPVIVGQ